jgi:precorrin-3B C17-methyltransferase
LFVLYSTISLSDLLTPWDTIERRLFAAAEADFVLALYNPISSKRRWQLPRALQILSQHRAPQTPVVIARNVMRADESIVVTSLAEVDADNVDMLSVVLIGNRETRRVGRWVYTPRGYAAKEPQR